MPVRFRDSIINHQIQFKWYLDYAMAKSPTARDALNNLFNNDYVLVQTNTNGNTHYDNESGVLHWDPTNAPKILTTNGTIEVVSPGRALLHELMHRITPGLGDADEVVAREFENQVARELGQPIRANSSINLGSVKTNDVSAYTDGGKWVTVDSDTLEKVLGPTYDPNKTVIVIGSNTQPNGSGGAESGGSSGSGSSGGGGTTGGGGGNPNVDVIPANPNGPPIRENEGFTIDPESDFHNSGIREGYVGEIIYAPHAEISTIEIIGISENYPVF